MWLTKHAAKVGEVALTVSGKEFGSIPAPCCPPGLTMEGSEI